MEPNIDWIISGQACDVYDIAKLVISLQEPSEINELLDPINEKKS